MADEIFVGSVSVGVVPDLRGFNTKLRAELVPSANAIGREMGTAISKGISDNLGVTKVSLAKMRKQVTDGLKDIKVNVGIDVSKVALDELKKKIALGLKDIKIIVNVDVTEENLRAVKIKIYEKLSNIKIYVKVDASNVSIADTRRKIKEGLDGINVRVGVDDIGAAVAAAGSGARGGGGRRDTGLIGGISALIKALPGGTSGSLAAVPPQIAIPAGVIAAASLPFLGQALSGLLVGGLGAGLAGIGVAGAFGPGGTTQQQVAQAGATSLRRRRLRAAQVGRRSRTITGERTSLGLRASLSAAQGA